MSIYLKSCIHITMQELLKLLLRGFIISTSVLLALLALGMLALYLTRN